MSFRRLAYLGTPAIAVPPLDALVANGFPVTDVVTRPDARRGRGSTTSASPVKQAAQRHGLGIHHSVDDLLGLGIDLGVVVAFGQIIKPHVLAEIPMVNLHFSLLPRWRGAAPVERAILAGDTVTGVCLMEVTRGLDEGGVFAHVEVPIGDTTTATELRADLVEAGVGLLLDALTGGSTAGLGEPRPQTGEVTYAAKITSADLRLDWDADPVQLLRQVRVGGAWTTLRGKRLKVLRAHLGPGGLELDEVQPEGRGPMPWSDFVRGARLAPHERLGS